MVQGWSFMKRKIAAIFAADIAGYSRLVAEDEEETLRRLAAYRSVTDDFIAKPLSVCICSTHRTLLFGRA